MIVYRICRKKEFERIMNNKSFANIGSICTENPKINSHKYKNNEKYLHFFKSYDSVFYLYVTTDNYICTYDIPNELLKKNMGVGYYLDRIYMEKLESVAEYAIPSREIQFSYLQRVDKVKNYIDFEDFLDDDYADSLETVFDVTEKAKCYRKQIPNSSSFFTFQ